MVKNLVVLAGVMLMCGCATNSTAYRYAENAQPITEKQAQYFISDINVKIDQVKSIAGYPNETELAQIFKTKLEDGLAKQNKLVAADSVDALGVAFDIRYKRVFSGEGFGMAGAVGRPVVAIESKILNDGKIIASYSQENVTTNHGLFGNFATIGKQLSQSAGPEEELKDIDILTQGMVDNLVNIGR